MNMLQDSCLWKWQRGVKSVASLECIWLHKGCICIRPHKALMNSRGEKKSELGQYQLLVG